MKKFKETGSDKNILQALALARKEFPNDAKFGSVIAKFLLEIKTKAAPYSDEDLYNLMELHIKSDTSVY